MNDAPVVGHCSFAPCVSPDIITLPNSSEPTVCVTTALILSSNSDNMFKLRHIQSLCNQLAIAINELEIAPSFIATSTNSRDQNELADKEATDKCTSTKR